MSIMKLVGFDGQIERQVARGDVFALAEVMPAAVTTAANLTITGAMLAAGLILRNPGGVSNENLDTAANIVLALSQGLGTTGIEPGTSFRCRWVNQAAFALTLVATANTGITLTGTATVIASGAKDVLVQIQNGTPAKTTLANTTTSGSAVVGGFSDAEIAAVSPGMIVLNAVANLQGQTILGVSLAAKTVTMSGNANATSTVSIQFSPLINFYAIGCTTAL